MAVNLTSEPVRSRGGQGGSRSPWAWSWLAGAIAALVLALGLGGSDPPEVEIEQIVDARRAPAAARASGDPLAWTPETARGARRAGDARHLARDLREEPGRRRRLGRADRRLARRDRGGGRSATGSIRTCSRRWSSSRARAARQVMADGTPNSASGPRADHPLDRDRPARHAGRPAAQHRADAADRQGARARARPSSPRGSSRERAEVDERFDPKRALEGRRPLPADRRRTGSAPRSSRSSRTTWGSATSRT